MAKLQAIAQNNPDRRIFVRGDKELAYGRIMEVMGTITQGGFTKVALLAEQTGRRHRRHCAARRRHRPRERPASPAAAPPRPAPPPRQLPPHRSATAELRGAAIGCGDPRT